jgi:multiple sugar transport system permease protein
MPLWWMFSASLRAPGLLPPQTFEWLPANPTFEIYIRIFKILPFGRYILNSSFVAISGVLITLVTASWAGFGMSMLGKRARLRFLMLSIILQVIPVTAFWLTRFLFLSNLGITNSRFSLIAPALMGTNSIFILLFYWTFRRTDRAIFESSELDGANLFQTWWHIAIPLARPALMAVGMLAFLFFWNDFINPLLYLRSQSLYTLPVGLLQLQEMDKTNWSLLMAASVVATIPVLIIFSMLQRSLLSWDDGE